MSQKIFHLIISKRLSCVYHISVDYGSINVDDILYIYKYLMKKHKLMFILIKQVFIALLSFSGSLARIDNFSNFMACIYLNNQLCMTRPIVINLNSDEYNQGLHNYPIMVKSGRCNESFNTLPGPSGRFV